MADISVLFAQTAPSRTQGPITWTGKALAALTLLYIGCALIRAAQTPLWMDEVLALEVARQAGLAGLWNAIWTGTDFSPPTFHVLLHSLPGLTAHPRIIARIPSILAALAAAACIHAIARRSVGREWATLAFAMTLASPLFDFALQARQYALQTFLLAFALWQWSSWPHKPRAGQVVLLWATLALMLSVHFYGIVLAGAVVLCEALWTWQQRTIRRSAWLGFVMLVPVFAAWLPLARHLRTFGMADQTGPGFYGYPTIARLFQGSAALVLGHGPQALAFLAIVLVLVCASGLKPRTIPALTQPGPLPLIMIALCAIPPAAFALAVVATGSFVPRYAVGAVLVPGLFAAWLAGRHHPSAPRPVLVTVLSITAISLVWQSQLRLRAQTIAAASSALAAIPAGQRVMTGDGQLYIELTQALPPGQADHLAYLAAPPSLSSPDPTNEHEVERLGTLDPRFKVVPFSRATAPGSSFFLLHTTPGMVDMASARIIPDAAIARLVTRSQDAEIYHVQMPATATPPQEGHLPR